MELTWFKSNLIVFFAGMSLSNSSEFQRCHGYCGCSVWTGCYRHSDLFSFKIYCFWFPSLIAHLAICGRTGRVSLCRAQCLWGRWTGVASGAWPPPLERGLALLLVDFSTWEMTTRRTRLSQVWPRFAQGGLRETLRASLGRLTLFSSHSSFSQKHPGNCHNGQTQNGIDMGSWDPEQTAVAVERWGKS